MRTPLATTALLSAVLLTIPALAACTSNTTSDENPSGAGDRVLTVNSADSTCEVSAGEAPAGALTFDVTNTGSEVTEFYLLADDGLRIVGEVENIGPNVGRKLTVTVVAGEYFTACKPGMVGEGQRADFTVTESDDAPVITAGDRELVEQALTNYQGYIKDQSAQLVAQTKDFVALYKAGDADDAARELYPVARTHWERIETVAESFGDLDPKMDLREADVEPGAEWTGWHLIEKDLWPAEALDYTALTDVERTTYADDLLANTEELDTRVQELEYTIDDVANGSRGLLEEVATGKLTGEEEIWSHTDLWDFQANVDGARVGFDGVEPIVKANDPGLAEKLTQRFDELQALLDSHREGDGFVLYTDLSDAEIKALSEAVNALSEPLSMLTAAVA